MLLLLACQTDPNPPKDTDTGAPLVDTATDSPADSADTADSGVTVDTSPTAVSCSALVEAATTLLNTLPEDQAAAIHFSMEDGNRNNWSNLPVPSVPRDGVQIGDMDAEAQAAAWRLLQASLSEVGYEQALGIVALDEYDSDSVIEGSEFYTWAIYGTPSETERWAWQFDGHHLVYNFTVTCPDVIMAPNLLGANPGVVPDGPMIGQDSLSAERDAAFAVLESLTPDQQAVAVAGTFDMGDLVVGPDSDWTFPDPEGLQANALDEEQRQLLLDEIERWVEDQEEDYAALRMTQIEAELDDTYFLWVGGAVPTSMYYFRIHGPSLWIEWDCNGSSNHYHAVYRNPVEDYGGDVLAKHHARRPHTWGLAR